MTPTQLRDSQEHDLSLVLGPYLGIAAVLVLIWLLIALAQDVDAGGAQPRRTARPRSGAFGRLWRNRHYRYGVAAQFFNVAAQVCAWSFTIQYARDVVGVPADERGLVPAGQPAPVPRLALRDDVPARDLPADAAAVRSWARSGSASR